MSFSLFGSVWLDGSAAADRNECPMPLTRWGIVNIPGFDPRVSRRIKELVRGTKSLNTNAETADEALVAKEGDDKVICG
jgi:hypothetical protein